MKNIRFIFAAFIIALCPAVSFAACTATGIKFIQVKGDNLSDASNKAQQECEKLGYDTFNFTSGGGDGTVSGSCSCKGGGGGTDSAPASGGGGAQSEKSCAAGQYLQGNICLDCHEGSTSEGGTAAGCEACSLGKTNKGDRNSECNLDCENKHKGVREGSAGWEEPKWRSQSLNMDTVDNLCKIKSNGCEAGYKFQGNKCVEKTDADKAKDLACPQDSYYNTTDGGCKKCPDGQKQRSDNLGCETDKSKEIKITYNLNGGELNGSGRSITETCVLGKTFSSKAAPTKKNSAFKNWKYSNGAAPVNAGVSGLECRADMTLTAEWTDVTDQNQTACGKIANAEWGSVVKKCKCKSGYEWKDGKENTSCVITSRNEASNRDAAADSAIDVTNALRSATAAVNENDNQKLKSAAGDLKSATSDLKKTVGKGDSDVRFQQLTSDTRLKGAATDLITALETQSTENPDLRAVATKLGAAMQEALASTDAAGLAAALDKAFAALDEAVPVLKREIKAETAAEKEFRKQFDAITERFKAKVASVRRGE